MEDILDELFFLKSAWIIAGVFFSRPTTRLTDSFSSCGMSPVRRATRRECMAKAKLSLALAASETAFAEQAVPTLMRNVGPRSSGKYISACSKAELQALSKMKGWRPLTAETFPALTGLPLKVRL